MDQHPFSEVSLDLRVAQETIERQGREIEHLKSRLEREQFAQALQQVLTSATAVNTILTPFTRPHLLEMVVQTAVSVISAQSGSLFLVDDEEHDLVFEVAIGPAAQEVKKFRVPIGHGIAGMVAMTGQSMAISNAQQDTRHAADIASSVNYLPENILCVPLFYDDQVIGVIELLDKIGAEQFSTSDMETLALFANIAAVAIAQSQAQHDQRSVLHSLLLSFGETHPEDSAYLSARSLAFSTWTNTANTQSIKARELASQVHELILLGEYECTLCTEILKGFVTAIRSYKAVKPSNVSLPFQL